MKYPAAALLLALATTAFASGWVEGHHYTRGQIVGYNGQQYEALQNHKAEKGAGWNPEAAPSLWRKLDRHTGHGGGWQEGRQYTKGQVIRYHGQAYRCLQGHKAEPGAGWSPDRAPSLWEKLDHDDNTRPR
ncbi:carbohydrate-binding protein [Chitinibacteraceae bacterium HSL-7]